MKMLEILFTNLKKQSTLSAETYSNKTEGMSSNKH